MNRLGYLPIFAKVGKPGNTSALHETKRGVRYVTAMSKFHKKFVGNLNFPTILTIFADGKVLGY